MPPPSAKAKKTSGFTSGTERKVARVKKSKMATTSKRSSREGSVYDQQMDISKALFPLSHYINDRTELVDQVFLATSRKGHLEAVLPDVLKDMPLSELKQKCLQQLEVMSKKRIKRLLLGEEMESSSGTEEEEEESENELENQESGTTTPQVADSTGMEFTDEEQNQNCVTLSEKATECLESNELPSTDMLELHPDSEGEDNLLTDCDNTESDDDEKAKTELSVSTPLTVQNLPLSEGSSTIAKTCLEILELELRARAIKSLLKAHPLPTNFDT